MSSVKEHLHIAYTVQNVGGINLRLDVGDAIPVKYTFLGLQKAGHQISLLAPSKRSVACYHDILNLDTHEKVSLGVTDKRPFLLIEKGIRFTQTKLKIPYFALFDSLRFYEGCVQALPHFDLCHEHNGLFSVGAALACVRQKIPYVLTFSADPLLEYKLLGRPLRGIHAWVAAQTARFTYRAAQKIICVSKPAKQHLIDVWQVEPDKICVMPNGVDTTLFGQSVDKRAIRTELGLGEAPVVTFVGGFQAWHGLDLLVASFAQVRQVLPQARLLLVGDGPVRPMVEEKAAELGIREALLITGMVPQGDVPKYLAVSDVVTLPYPRLPKELWFSPLKLYEYMAAGKAIVASAAGQIADVIQDGHNGLLVESGNMMALGQAVTHLLQAPAERERLGQTAQAQAVAHHSWDQYIERLEAIYRTVLA